MQSTNRFSVDCSNAHKGLFSGILILVMTIISLIMFIVMKKDPNLFEIAKEEVHIWELLMYVLTTIVVIVGAWQMRCLEFNLKDRCKLSLRRKPFFGCFADPDIGKMRRLLSLLSGDSVPHFPFLHIFLQ